MMVLEAAAVVDGGGRPNRIALSHQDAVKSERLSAALVCGIVIINCSRIGGTGALE